MLAEVRHSWQEGLKWCSAEKFCRLHSDLAVEKYELQKQLALYQVRIRFKSTYSRPSVAIASFIQSQTDLKRSSDSSSTAESISAEKDALTGKRKARYIVVLVNNSEAMCE